MTNDSSGESVPRGTPAESTAPGAESTASPGAESTAAPGTAAPGPASPPPYGPPPGPGLAGRYGLVRPIHGRYVAGVCAAVARATNTDPVLWRVLVAVLTLFGGVGLLLYLLGWLLIPAEGDTASPMEALAGRGYSNTSPLTVVLITIVAVLAFLFVVTDGFRVAVLGVVALIAALVLFARNADRPGFRHFGPAGSAGPPPGWPPPAGPQPGGPPPAWPEPAGPTSAAGPVPPPAAVPVPPPVGGYPPPPPGGYRPPFAPHGPYGGPPPPPVAPPKAPKPPKPPHERSPLGRIVLSLICVVLGTVAVIDLAVARVPASAYIAAALAMVGIGLLIGAWLGRARWLIALGLVLAVSLGVVSVAEHERFRHYRERPAVVWQPESLAELQDSYRLEFGTATLDLRGVDFAAAPDPVRVDVSVDLGRLEILLPPNVDVDVTANVDLGDATVLGERWGGIDTPTQRVQDTGLDGTGGGQLLLTARIDAGNLEVRR